MSSKFLPTPMSWNLGGIMRVAFPEPNDNLSHHHTPKRRIKLECALLSRICVQWPDVYGWHLNSAWLLYLSCCCFSLLCLNFFFLSPVALRHVGFYYLSMYLLLWWAHSSLGALIFSFSESLNSDRMLCSLVPLSCPTSWYPNVCDRAENSSSPWSLNFWSVGCRQVAGALQQARCACVILLPLLS